MKASISYSTDSGMQFLMESFDLERCSHMVCPDVKESLPGRGSVSLMPPPSKFLARSSTVQERRYDCVDSSAMAQVKEKLFRSMGEMISREESAQWVCGDEESQRSARVTANLIAGFRTP